MIANTMQEIAEQDYAHDPSWVLGTERGGVCRAHPPRLWVERPTGGWYCGLCHPCPVEEADNFGIVPHGEWYEALVEECKAIVTEAVFTSRWALVEGYHALGERVVTDTNLDRQSVYGKRILSDLSKSSGVGERTLYRAIEFYRKYPDLDHVPEGKNISWTKVVTKYLPEPKETAESVFPLLIDCPTEQARTVLSDRLKGEGLPVRCLSIRSR